MTVGPLVSVRSVVELGAAPTVTFFFCTPGAYSEPCPSYRKPGPGPPLLLAVLVAAAPAEAAAAAAATAATRASGPEVGATGEAAVGAEEETAGIAVAAADTEEEKEEEGAEAVLCEGSCLREFCSSMRNCGVGRGKSEGRFAAGRRGETRTRW